MDGDSQDSTPEQIQINESLLRACRTFDFDFVKKLEEDKPDYWYQPPEDGKGPLHLVVEAAKDKDWSDVNVFILHLLGNGAIWNQMSHANETPGCIARRLYGATSQVYHCFVSAGVRAELLLTVLDKSNGSHDPSSRNEAFLNGKLEYTEPTDSARTLLDAENNAIMMSWESDIMVKSAKVIVPPDSEESRSILNIGFGLGLIDTAIQALNPTRHVIIEAHPDVLRQMRALGWYEKPNVEILEGKWQDLVDDLADRETFDGIYYDPFEYWDDMHHFFDSLVALLNPTGTFSFFHGLGADNQTFYDVYTQILEIELRDFGLTVDFEELVVDEVNDEEWVGAKRRYWTLPIYRLPTCKFQQ